MRRLLLIALMGWYADFSIAGGGSYEALPCLSDVVREWGAWSSERILEPLPPRTLTLLPPDELAQRVHLGVVQHVLKQNSASEKRCEMIGRQFLRFSFEVGGSVAAGARIPGVTAVGFAEPPKEGVRQLHLENLRFQTENNETSLIVRRLDLDLDGSIPRVLKIEGAFGILKKGILSPTSELDYAMGTLPTELRPSSCPLEVASMAFDTALLWR